MNYSVLCRYGKNTCEKWFVFEWIYRLFYWFSPASTALYCNWQEVCLKFSLFLAQRLFTLCATTTSVTAFCRSAKSASEAVQCRSKIRPSVFLFRKPQKHVKMFINSCEIRIFRTRFTLNFLAFFDSAFCMGIFGIIFLNLLNLVTGIDGAIDCDAVCAKVDLKDCKGVHGVHVFVR